jgi:hypothetical protein
LLKVDPREADSPAILTELLNTRLEDFAEVRRVEDASDLVGCLQSDPLSNHRKWAFRGHSDANWALEPLLDRLRNRYRENCRGDTEEMLAAHLSAAPTST